MTRSIALAAFTLLAACPGGQAGPDATPCELELSWGPRRTGDFQPFSDGDTAEITLGFQGFRYIDSSLRVVVDDADIAEVWFQVAIEGFEPYGQQRRVDVSDAEPDGARYADDVLVFFNDIPIAELVGRTAEITVRATAAGCVGAGGAAVTLADDDGCVEQPDGGLECE